MKSNSIAGGISAEISTRAQQSEAIRCATGCPSVGAVDDRQSTSAEDAPRAEGPSDYPRQHPRVLPLTN